MKDVSSFFACPQNNASGPEASASAAPSETRERLRTWAAEYEASSDAEAAEKLHQVRVTRVRGGRFHVMSSRKPAVA